MKRALFACAISVLGVGCGQSAVQTARSADKATVAAEKVDVALAPMAEAPPPQTSRMRAPGDFVVYRFSGSYRDAPVTLTQKVVSREGGYLTVDVTLDEGGAQQRLRLRMSDEGPRAGELLSVAKLEGDVQVPLGIAAYGQLMNDVVLSADENSGIVDATTMLVDVGGDDLYCDVTSYQVRVGAHDAVMTTVSSDEFAWGHVAGEIATFDGSLLYKAEIVDIGSGTGAEVAASEDSEIYESDYDHFEE